MPRNKKPLDPEKQLTIKTRACQRLAKEASYYVKEVDENKGKLEKMIADNRDFYDIKKFKEVLGESEMMVPDSKKRLKKNLKELSEFIKVHNEVLDAEGEWLMTAKDILKEYDIEVELKSEQEKDDVIETNVADVNEGEVF